MENKQESKLLPAEEALIPKVVPEKNNSVALPNSNKDAKKETQILPKNDSEKQLEEPVNYPRSVFFILPFTISERYSFHAIRTLLTIYLCDKFGMDNDGATTIFHSFTMFAYFFPIFGAMIADSWLGKFKTIFFSALIYIVGVLTVSTGSLPVLFNVQSSLIVTIIGLLLVAMGTGGIVPCISAFGGDQFKVPQQERQLVEFFSIFFVFVNIGVLVSRFISPVLRGDVHCFGEDSCYTLAFSVPAILMGISSVFYLFARNRYTIKQPQGNMVVQVFKCIRYAMSRKKLMKKYKRKNHWLDYADDKYDKSFIDGVKTVLQVLVLYIPLPIFWALFDQEGSRWTLQAKQMNGQIGSFTIKPDQMQTLNPLFCLILIPLFDKVIYPAFAKYNLLKRPLKRIFFGGLLAACAFIISGTVEIALQKTYNTLPGDGSSELRIYNGYNCPLNISFHKNGTNVIINNLDSYVLKDIQYSRHTWRNKIPYSVECDCCGIFANEHNFKTFNEDQSSFFFKQGVENDTSEMVYFHDNTDEATAHGMPQLRILVNSLKDFNIEIRKHFDTLHKFNSKNLDNQHVFIPDQYELYINEDKVKDLDLKLGEVYTLIIDPDEESGSFAMNIVKEDKPETLHMLWLLPQYLVMAVGEVMFSVTGLEFSYSQAPASMKSVLQAFWLLTTAFGNMIVVIIAGVKISESQSIEFFFFAALMFLTMIIFLILSRSFKYADKEKKQDVVNEYQSWMELSQMK